MGQGWKLYNKCLFAFVFICMFFVTPLCVQAQNTGDVNNDGSIDAIDALQVVRHAVREKVISGDQFAIADVTKNNKINSTDALEILQYSVGKITSFERITVLEMEKGSWGVDVSEWQPIDINWSTAKRNGVSFAFLRCTVGWPSCPRGTGFKDEHFETYYQRARAAGIPVGVYHFSWARSVADAKAEAAYVLKILNGRDLDLPVVLDIENSYHRDLGKATFTAACTAFCDIIKAGGYQPMIYSYYTMLTNYLDFSKVSSDYGIWMAHTANTTDFPYRYDIWQYGQSVISGMGSKGIDVNRLMRDYVIVKDRTLKVQSVNDKVMEDEASIIESAMPAPEPLPDNAVAPVGDNVMGSGWWESEFDSK